MRSQRSQWIAGVAQEQVASMIDLVFGFFALPWVPWTLSGLLIAGALAIWVDFRRRLQPVLEGLEDALRVIEEAPSASALHDRFSSINQRLASNPVIGEAWRAFVGTLVPVPGQDGVLGATRRPREDLNESILTSAGVNLRFYTAVPNYLVGLGLLFTFAGLVAALYFASGGVAAASIQEAQASLRHLLAAATFKFVTSIAGLGASIVYSSREKTQLYRLGHRLDVLCTALEQRLVPVTPEYLGTVQLAEMRNQSLLLRRLGRHLHVTIPDTVEERLASELLDAIAPMREGFARAAERIGRMDDALAARLFDASATPPSGQGIGQYGAAFDATALGQIVEELRLVREAILALPALPAASRLEQRAVAGDPVDPLLAKLIDLLETSSAGIAALDTSIDASLAQINQAYRTFRAEAPAGQLPAQMPARLKDSIARLADVRAELGELGRGFREVAASSRMIGGDAGRSEAALMAEIEQLGQHVLRFNERVRSFVRRVDEELARSSRLLSNAVDRSGEN
jgi:hypothetical protein